MRRLICSALLMMAACARALAHECPAGDLAAGKPVGAIGTRGDPASITSATRVRDQSPWNDRRALIFADRNARAVVDLGDTASIGRLELQADNDDDYEIDASLDGATFHPIAVAERVSGGGLRTRVIDVRAAARYLRLAPLEGDGHFSVAHVGAFCEQRAAASRTAATLRPPDRRSDRRWWSWRALADGDVLLLKGLVAFAGFLLLALGWYRRRTAQRSPRWRRPLLALITFCSFAGFFSFGHFHFDSFIHVHEFFHYYLGAKYLPELGYTRLYACALVAESEVLPAAALEHGRVRDLATRELTDVETVLAHPERCTQRFSPPRWSAFRDDVMFFRAQTSHEHWVHAMLGDYGFNGSPAWAVAGHALSATGAASRRQIVALASVDVVLLVVMWLAVFWAFGFEASCAAVIYWGTNYAARYMWNGGAFLRMDWLCALVVGICLLRRERLFGAGFALATAALLRVFPAAALGGVALVAAVACARDKSWRPLLRQRAFWAGVTVAGVSFVAATSAVVGVGHTIETWRAFVDNGRLHHASVMTNHVGLRTLLSFSPGTRALRLWDASGGDPWTMYRAAHLETFSARLPLTLLLRGLFVLLLVRAAARRPAWMMAVLALGLVPVVMYLACYYYSFLLVFALLAAEESAFAPSVAAVAVGSALAPALFAQADDQYVFVSLIVVVFVYLAAAWAASGKRAANDPLPALRRE